MNAFGAMRQLRNKHISSESTSRAAAYQHARSRSAGAMQFKANDRAPYININQSKDSGKTDAMKSKYFGQDGTWHHIYPRESLKTSLTTIKTALTNNDSKPAMPSSIGIKIMRNAATWDSSASRKFYWHPGNGFAGVLNSLRSDDPGNNPEPAAPGTMLPVKFQAAVDWGQAVRNYATVMSGEPESKRRTSSTVKAAKKTVDTEAAKMRGTPFHSAEGDWTKNGEKYHL